jgi:acetyl esterase/lipase
MIKHVWRVALLLVATSGVHAQPVSDPALLQAYAAIRAMGPNLNPQVIEQTGKLYAEIHKTTDKGNLDVTRDVKYGPDAKNAMDIYRPAQASGGPRPAVVFIHGGGLTGGDKVNPLSDLMNANVATYFARHDMVGINATYRLVPNIRYPQGAEDMKAIVGWIRDNAAEYGIDPDRIFFLCASAGCTHVASLLFDPNMMFDKDPDIAGAIMLSGAYQAANEDYFGSDPAKRELSSGFNMASEYRGRDVPVFLLSAQYDPHGIESGTAQMYQILCRTRAACPRFAQARDHNHISINQHINSGDERYTGMMLEFIHDVTGDE